YTKNIALVFDASLVRKRETAQSALLSLQSAHHLQLSDKQAATIEYLLKRIADEYERKEPCFEEIVVNYVVAFLTILQRVAAGSSTVQGNKDPIIVEVLKYLEKEFTNVPSLTEASDRFGLSSYTLSKKFKQYVGVGFLEYLIHLRIEEARRLLAETDLNVTEVAYEVGFDSLSTFYRDFRRLTQLTPVAYRKLCMDYGSPPLK
ncbi:MAG TPA: AraC family transcriptional regulator, partial [Armatimonadota bacterium]